MFYPKCFRESLAQSRHSIKIERHTNDMLASVSCILGHMAAAGDSVGAGVCWRRSCKRLHFAWTATWSESPFALQSTIILCYQVQTGF